MKRTFTGKTRIFLGISCAIIVVALIMQICGVGINLGIDFTGGSLLTYSVGEDYDVEDVEKILTAAGYTEFQVTKTAPSEASQAIRDNLAAEKAAEEAAAEAVETAEETAEAVEEAAEETAEAVEETAEETAEAVEETAEETAEAVEAVEATAKASLLDTDKSGITADGLTDLQIRLDLVDEAADLEKDLTEAVQATYANAKLINYGDITNILINQRDFDSSFAGGFIAEFEMDEDFDNNAAVEYVRAALEAKEYSLTNITAYHFDPAAEAAADEAEKAALEAVEETAEEATEETIEEATEETTEEAAEETAEEAVEETEPEGNCLRLLVAINDQTSQVRNMIETEMKAKYPDFVFVTIDHVSAVAGKDLIANAVKALLIAFACMLIYIAIRFDFYSGVCAIGALLHDMLIMCSFMVFFRGLFQANSPFIAALLTIVGYSINNTIIIFDRIRENGKKPGQTQMKKIDIVEMSVSQTLSRTINTTITTMITLVCLYIFGVDSIREFAFPLIIGMLAGTYSSLLLSGQVWAMWQDKRASKKAAAKG